MLGRMYLIILINGSIKLMGKNGLKSLFQDKNNTQDNIIKRIDQMWKAYTTNKYNSHNTNGKEK